jgi:hypothetical protein
VATAMFAETLDNTQHSTRLIPESRSYTLNSSRENQKTRCYIIGFSSNLGILAVLTEAVRGFPQSHHVNAWIVFWNN